MHFDVFNGDADGILALLQLRLAKPMVSQLISGVKRDISLLQQVDRTMATSVTALDISMEKNIEALIPLLTQEVPVFYVDHHRAGDIPNSRFLTAKIDTRPDTCTSLIINHYLHRQFELWAIAAAFGDNMDKSAIQLTKHHSLQESDVSALKQLGMLINYNGYGRTVDDLHISPIELYRQLLPYQSPFELLADAKPLVDMLESAYQSDMSSAANSTVVFANDKVSVISLPDKAWARRVSGVFGNQLANDNPDKAHAVLTLNQDQSYTVSVRAPLNNRQGADVVCSQFDTGGGRSAAAGINKLLPTNIPTLIDSLTRQYLN